MVDSCKIDVTSIIIDHVNSFKMCHVPCITLRKILLLPSLIVVSEHLHQIMQNRKLALFYTFKPQNH